MRKIVLSLFIAVISFSFLVMDAQAKRFGGGKSFGMSRQASSFSKPQSHNYATPASAAKPASTASRWLGPLAGLAMGGLLASLFMGHGLGTGIFSWLLLLGGAFLVWNLIRAKLQSPRNQPMAYQAQPMQSSAAASVPFFGDKSSTQTSEPLTDFDENAFLRNAKALFIRLQAAYDNKNLADMREFTAPEVFAEIQLQLQERGNEINQTDVISIDAKLLDLTTQANAMVASVEFFGQLREEANAPLETIKEVWHLQKYNDRSTWVVAGIQQG